MPDYRALHPKHQETDEQNQHKLTHLGETAAQEVELSSDYGNDSHVERSSHKLDATHNSDLQGKAISHSQEHERQIVNDRASAKLELTNYADLQPWQAIESVLLENFSNTHTQQKSVCHEREKKYDVQDSDRQSFTDYLQTESKEAEREKSVVQSTAASVQTLTEDRGQEQIDDHKSLDTSIKKYMRIEPWQAIENRFSVELNVDERDWQSSPRLDIEDKNSHRIKDEKSQQLQDLAIDRPSIENRAVEKLIRCVLPVDVAKEAVDISALEPETLVYLTDKYKFIERNIEVESGKFPETDRRLGLAERDVFEPLVSSRDESQSTKGESLAKAQIDRLQAVERKFENSPKLHNYVELTITNDLDKDCFKIVHAHDVDWKILEHPQSLQQIIEERLSSTTTRDREQNDVTKLRLKPTRNRASRSFITTVSRDLKKLELDLNRLEDAEPEPGKFCTVRSSQHSRSVKFWEARTIEEFENTDRGVPATPEAIQEIVNIDRQWKLWHARSEHAKAQVQDTRIELREIETSHDEHEIDYDDFDR